MKVTLFYGGGATRSSRHDECDIEDLVNFTEIELSRVPQKGEYLDLWIGDYWIEGTVKEHSWQSAQEGICVGRELLDIY